MECAEAAKREVTLACARGPIESPRVSTGLKMSSSCDGCSASLLGSGVVPRDCGRVVQRLQPMPLPNRPRGLELPASPAK
jgi:hypothetical protein